MGQLDSEEGRAAAPINVRIDAHQHLWKVARADYGWLTAASVPTIYRDFLADDLRPLLRDAHIDKTILVQAAESIDETQYLLSIAQRESFVGGVVGWVDFENADAPLHIERLAQNTKLVGLRPMVQDMPDVRWILREQFTPVLQAMQSHALRFDALIKPRHLDVIAEFIARHPQLPIVIDHAAKPDIANKDFAPWRAGIKRIAAAPHVHCKVSGLATEAGPHWDAETLRPYVDVLLDCFGPHRLMWGSDWPVLLLAGGYMQWLEVAEHLTAQLNAVDRARIFGGTAAAFYGSVE